MATERASIHPFGGVVYTDTNDETYLHPFGGVLNNGLDAAAPGGVTPIPPPIHGLDNQHSVIMTNRLNGVIQ